MLLPRSSENWEPAPENWGECFWNKFTPILVDMLMLDHPQRWLKNWEGPIFWDYGGTLPKKMEPLTHLGISYPLGHCYWAWLPC